MSPVRLRTHNTIRYIFVQQQNVLKNRTGCKLETDIKQPSVNLT